MRAALIFVSVICVVSAAKLGQNGKTNVKELLLKVLSEKNFNNDMAKSTVCGVFIGPGGAFSDKEYFEANGIPTVMKFWQADNYDIIGVRVKYGDVWAPLRGSDSGELFTFEPQAAITMIGGDVGPNNKLVFAFFYDGFDQHFVGSTENSYLTDFIHYPFMSGNSLKYISGYAASSGLEQINFEYC